jgi:hypothetical protein
VAKAKRNELDKAMIAFAKGFIPDMITPNGYRFGDLTPVELIDFFGDKSMEEIVSLLIDQESDDEVRLLEDGSAPISPAAECKRTVDDVITDSAKYMEKANARLSKR